MIHARSFVALAAAGAFVFAVAAQDTHTIAWKPEAGKELKYSLKMSGEMNAGPQGAMALDVKMVLTNKVVEVKDDKITMEGKMSDFSVSIGGNDITEMAGGQMPADAPAVKTVFSRTGELLSMSGGSEMTTPPRVQNLQIFVYPTAPVKVGDSWTREVKADKEKGIPAGKGKFTLAGVETVKGIEVFKIDFAYSELDGDRPMGNIGTVWLEKSDGSLYRVKSTLNDVKFAEMMPPMNMNVEMTRL